jgi:hypothetical protein
VFRQTTEQQPADESAEKDLRGRDPGWLIEGTPTDKSASRGEERQDQNHDGHPID